MKLKKAGIVGGALVLCVALWDRPLGRIYYVPSGSMTPTLPVNARLWASPLPYRIGVPKAGDIALFDIPLSVALPGSDAGKGSMTFVKRIVGVPGDRVEIVNGTLKRNGAAQKEPYLARSSFPSYDMKVVKGQIYSREHDPQGMAEDWTHGEDLVPEERQGAISHAQTEPLPPHKYVVLGDNRGNSNDSHVFGTIDRSQIEAKVTTRLFPNPRAF